MGVHDWQEVQANKGMASILMPRRLFAEVALHEKKLQAAPDEPLQSDSQEAAALTALLAARFSVSLTAGVYPLRRLVG